MSSDIQDAIVRAAGERGIDPAYALAIAERESKFNPNARASRTIYGLFQMSRPLRSQYGIGDSQDPYTQASGWARFTGDLKTDMAGRLGRDPTSEELYLGHYFGGARAARLISGQIPSSADVRDVFTPQEIRANPEIAKAATVGDLVASVEGDIGARIGRFGGNGAETNGKSGGNGPDFASFGLAKGGGGLTYKSTSSAQPVDFAALGAAQTAASAGTASSGEQQQPQPRQETEEEPAAPPIVPSITPAKIAMRNAVAQQGAPQVQNMPALPGGQPPSPPG